MSKTCFICNETAKYDQCKDCYYSVQRQITENSNLDKSEVTKAYGQLKYFIYRMSKQNELIGFRKMAALSQILLSQHKDGSLSKKVQNDISEIKERKNKGNSSNNDKAEKLTNDQLVDGDSAENDFRRIHPAEFHCHDGHYVRSPYEQTIDNYLTKNRIFHFYEKRYKNHETGETYYPDWFLPDIGEGGTYIECFGKRDEFYKQKTERKLDFYKREKIRIIPIYPKNIQNLDEYLEDQIASIKLGKFQNNF